MYSRRSIAAVPTAPAIAPRTARPTMPWPRALAFTLRSRAARRSRRRRPLGPRLDGPDRLLERALQAAFADSSHHQLEESSLEVLALADRDVVDVGRPVGVGLEGVGVARRATPGVGVGRRQDDVVRVGPVVVQALPDAH